MTEQQSIHLDRGRGLPPMLATGLADALSHALMLMEPSHQEALCERLRAAQPSRQTTGMLDPLRNPMSRTDGVAIIEIIGPMFPTRTRLGDFFGETPMDEVERELETARTDDSVHTVLMLIDSPGGSVAGTASLARAVALCAKAKLVIVFSPNVLASAAMWVASQASRIIVDKNCIVGSIGVRGPTLIDWSGMLEQMGLKTYPIGTSTFKLTGALGAVSKEQVADQERLVHEIHANFLAEVKRGRNLSAEQLTAVGDARVHVGPHAVTMKLADAVGSYDQAFAEARKGAESTARRPAGAKAHPTSAGSPAVTGNGDRNNEQNNPAGPGSAADNTDQTATVAADAGASASVADSGAGPSEEHLMSQTQQGAAAPAAAAPTSSEPAKTAAASAAAAAAVVTAPAATAPAAAPVATAPATATADPKPATIGELRAAFPGEPNATFVLEAAERGWTMTEAKSAHGVIESRVAAAIAQHATSQTAAAATKPIVTKPGVPAIASAAAEQGGSTASIAAGGDVKAQAKQEWASNANNCHDDFISEAAYVGWCVAESKGKIKTFGKKA